MKYEMPALTDAQREDAIKHAESLMRPDGKGLTTLIAKIALSSMTVKPFGYIQSSMQDAVHYVSAIEVPPINITKPLYTAPPVPVLKPIDLTSCRNLWYDHDDLSAEVKCIPVKDIKKAIRAAGYEVKE